MQPTIAANRGRENTRKQIPTALCMGGHRIRRPTWADVHALAIQGWAVQRIGSVLIAYYADVEEGTA